MARGETFLAGLFDPGMKLLPEFKGSRTYWLFHDNYLAAHLLSNSRPDLSAIIRGEFKKWGVTNSGKIEILFGEATKPLPFRQYVLTNVAAVGDRTIRTEIVTGEPFGAWQKYADLLLLASVAESRRAPREAKRHFETAALMWDGRGFKDAAVEKHQIYATYKLALYLVAAARLGIEAPHAAKVLAQLELMQDADGGWRTDYSAEGKPVGLTNVETTCMALLALQSAGIRPADPKE